MKLAHFESLRAKSNGRKSVDKVVVRCVYEVINTWRPTCAHATHDLTEKLLLEASRFKLDRRQALLVHTACDCVRYGWTQGVALKTVGVVTFPERATPRWKVLFNRCIEAGMNIARAQLNGVKA